MIRNILVTDYASLKESKLLPETNRTSKLFQADIVVNPCYGAICAKTVIINLPQDIPLEQLLPNNDVVSRFPIGYGIPVIPYDMPESRKEISEDDISLLILNKSMLTDTDKLKYLKSNNFIVGIDETIDGEATLIGLEILSNKIKEV